MATLSNEELTARLLAAEAAIRVLQNTNESLRKALEGCVDRVSVRKALAIRSRQFNSLATRLKTVEDSVTALSGAIGA